MNQYFGILGSHPHLSVAELAAVLPHDNRETTKEVVLFEADANMREISARLGGMQKLGSVIGSVYTQQELIDFLVAILAGNASGKIRFGISLYVLEEGELSRKISWAKDQIGIEIKKGLKRAGFPVRYVTSKEKNLSTVVSSKNHLDSTGGDIALFIDAKKIQIGQVDAIQDFEAWSHRDYDRPGRDAWRGMLPPKLARMMLNLAQPDLSTRTLLDPFCGSGTVLMEAAVLGARKIIGSDISAEAVEDTKKGLVWLEGEGQAMPLQEFHASKVTNLSALIDANSVDVIVTEPFLGKPRTGRETEEEVMQSVRDLEALYKESFTALYKLLKPGGTLVVASPVHFYKERPHAVETREILENIGFTDIPMSEHSLLYRRAGQFVGREIMKFER